MKKNYFFKSLAAVVLAGFVLTSCDDDPATGGNGGGNGEDPVESQYIVAAMVIDSDDSEVDYLLTSESLTEGSVTAIRDGKESDPAAYWVFHNNNYLYRLAYNQGEAGITSSYILNDQGALEEREYTFRITRFTTYGIYNDQIITSSTGNMPASYADENNYLPKGFLFTFLDVINETSRTNTEQFMSENYLGNGEFVTLAGLLQVNNKIYSAPIPMGLSQYGAAANNGEYVLPGNEDLVKKESGGANSGSYLKGELQWTQHPNEAYIAIYNNGNLETATPSKLLRTDKISYATGRFKSQYYQTIWPDGSNQYVYVFSPSYAKTVTDARQQTTLPAGVVRVNTSTEEFDENYYVNLEELSGGRSFQRCWHIGGNYFLMLMYNKPFSEADYAANQLAIFNATEETLTTVTGLPASDQVSSIGGAPYFEGNIAYVAVTPTDGDPSVYAIDPTNATATKGLSIVAETANGIGKLNVINQ